MSDQREWLDWRKTLTSTHTLVNELEAPLTALWTECARSEKILAALAPPVDELVDYSPFAPLAVTSPEPRPAAATPPMRRAAALPPSLSPSATATSPSTSALTPAASPRTLSAGQGDDSRNAPPVFALAGHKDTAAAGAPTAASRGHTPPTIPNRASPAAPVGIDEVVTVDTPPARLQTNHQGVSQPRPLSLTSMMTQRPLSALEPQATQVTGNGLLGDGLLDDALLGSGVIDPVAPLATMTLLATMTATLLSTPATQRAEDTALVRTGATRASPFPATQSRQLEQAPPGHPAPSPLPIIAVEQATGAAPLANTVAANALSAFPHTHLPEQVRIDTETHLPEQVRIDTEALRHRGGEGRQFTDLSSPAVVALNQPDAWTLAQLINDVLTAEARRHGVDLS